jgi:cell division protein FtsW
MRRSRTKVHFDEKLIFAFLTTLLLGLIMVYSSSSMLAGSRFGSQFFFLKQQFVWAALSLAVLFVITRIDLKRWAVYSAPALLITIILLVVVFAMPARNGSHRWLMLGPLTLQPSELFKFLLIVFLAFSLANPRRNLAQLRQVLIPYLPLIGCGLCLIVLEPDLGTVIVIVLTVLGLFFLAGAKIKHLLLATLPAIIGGATAVFGLGYKKARVMDYLASVSDPLAGSYHVKQAALTLGSGGLFGTGLGDGSQKLFFLPYPHTDFIFATIGEEIGFIGLMLVLGLLLFILWRGLKIASRQPDRFGFLLAAGMTWSLFVNIAINVGVVTALLPVTGLALPFLSYGGSSLLMSCASIGVLLNLSARMKPA